MSEKVKNLIDKLNKDKSLSLDQYKTLIEQYDSLDLEYAKSIAVDIRKSVYGNSVFIRGLIEVSNYCKNGCLYCGINRSNKNC